MKKNYIKIYCVTIVTSILLCFSYALGQTEVKNKEATTPKKYEIASVRLYDLDNVGIPKHYLSVRLTSPQTNNAAIQQSDLTPSNIIIKFLPSGRTIPANLINDLPAGDRVRPNTRNLGGAINGFKVIQIGLSDDPLARPDVAADGTKDTKVEITFKTLHFEGLSSPKKDVKGAGAIFDATNKKTLKDETFKELQNAVAQAKTTEEKNFFTDFNVSLPSSGGKTQGSGDFIFNRTLPNFMSVFDQVNFGFKLKKATEDKSDPRHFELGLTFRKTFLLADRTKLKTIKDVINNPNPSPADSENAVKEIAALQEDFVRAILFDSAIKFEADASNRGISNVSNLLYDGNIQVASVSKTFSKSGLFNFRFLPAGLEIGRNLTNNDDPNLAKRSLFRFKFGGEMNLIYKASEPKDLINRVTFNVQAIQRFLFLKENIWDETTKKVIGIDKGSKYWFQTSLKVSTSQDFGFGRVGFQMSYINGTLPPVYSFVKTFKFGVVFETKDDDNSKDAKP